MPFLFVSSPSQRNVNCHRLSHRNRKNKRKGWLITVDKMLKQVGIALGLLLVVGSVVAAGKMLPGESPQAEKQIDIAGTVTAVITGPIGGQPDQSADPSASVSSKDTPNGIDPAQPTGIVAIMVEADSQSGKTPYDKASVSLRKSPELLKKQGDSLVPATLDDLREGTRVEVSFDGPVAESYPVQATAGMIVIVE